MNIMVVVASNGYCSDITGQSVSNIIGVNCRSVEQWQITIALGEADHAQLFARYSVRHLHKYAVFRYEAVANRCLECLQLKQVNVVNTINSSPIVSMDGVSIGSDNGLSLIRC